MGLQCSSTSCHYIKQTYDNIYFIFYYYLISKNELYNLNKNFLCKESIAYYLEKPRLKFTFYHILSVC